MHRIAASVFGLTLALLMTFWFVDGTKPSGGSAMGILYGLLGLSGIVWLGAHPGLSWRSPIVRSRRGPARIEQESTKPPPAQTVVASSGSTDLALERMPREHANHALRSQQVNNLQDIVNELNSIRLRLNQARIAGFYPYNFGLPAGEYHAHNGLLRGAARRLAGQAYVQVDHLNNQFRLRSPEGDSAATYDADDLPGVIDLIDAATQAIVEQIDADEVTATWT